MFSGNIREKFQKSESKSGKTKFTRPVQQAHMKKLLGLVVAAAAAALIVAAADAREVVLQGTGATIHDLISPVPGSTEVNAPYRDAITLHVLKSGEQAFWNPVGGKYISAGKYAYLWCALYPKDSDKPKHKWIAVTDVALDKALDLIHKFDGGVAYYKLTFDGKQILFKAYTYSALNAMSQGKDTIAVDE